MKEKTMMRLWILILILSISFGCNSETKKEMAKEKLPTPAAAKQEAGVNIKPEIKSMIRTTPPKVDKTKKSPLPGGVEMPKHEYAITMSAMELIKNDKAFKTLIDQLEKDLNDDITQKKVTSPMILKQYYGALATIDFFNKRYDEGLKRITSIHENESDSVRKQTTGLIFKALVASIKGKDAPDVEIFKRELGKLIGGLDQNELLLQNLMQSVGKAQALTVDMFTNVIKMRVEPAAATGKIEANHAMMLAGIKWQFDYALQFKPAAMEIYKAQISKLKDSLGTSPKPTPTPAP